VSDEQLDETEEDARPEDGIFLQFAGRERHQAFVRAPRVLMEVPEHGDPEGSPENLVIEGDNLDAMSALRFQYGEQVDVAIVDPPYGGDRQDVRYRDDSTGWLNQMLPTFHLIREMLAETGVMFVHIDDDQLFNLGSCSTTSSTSATVSGSSSGRARPTTTRPRSRPSTSTSSATPRTVMSSRRPGAGRCRR
jgi:hypothetical protein